MLATVYQSASMSIGMRNPKQINAESDAAWHDPPMHIGDRIRSVRLAAGLSQVALARAASVQQATISRYESNGSKRHVAADLGAIAKVLKVTVEWLQTGIGGDPAEVETDPYRGDPRLAARTFFISDCEDNDQSPADVRVFVAEFDARAHKDAPVSPAGWLALYKDAWRQHRASQRGKGMGLGIGAREL